jgi:nucleotide-binding universal stress UspA family protein
MHVMVATDGSLDPATTAELAGRLAGKDGQVTVFSAVEIPRQLLNDMRAAASPPAPEIPASNVEYPSGQANAPSGTRWIGDDTAVSMYVGRKVHDQTDDLVSALAARSIEHDVVGVEAENPARSVLDAATELKVDVLCIGTHGLGRFEGFLGSTSTKLARLAPCSVVLVR